MSRDLKSEGHLFNRIQKEVTISITSNTFHGIASLKIIYAVYLKHRKISSL